MTPRLAFIAFGLFGALGAIAFSLPRSSSAGADDFYQAIHNNDLRALRKLIRSSNPKVHDTEGNTPLMYAAAFGSPESMRLLLAAGADPNAANKVAATPLMWCAGDIAKARMLIANGASVKAKSKDGREPLEIAAYYDRPPDVIRLLLDKGADVNARDLGGETALEVAANSNNLAGARLLLERGAKANTTDLGGFTPLIAAAQNGYRNTELVKLLLKHGASVNAKCTDVTGKVLNGPIRLGRLTALQQAAAGSFETVKALLDAGADVNAKDVRDSTPLVFAVATDHADPRIVKLLLARGATPEPALTWAKRYNNPAVMSLLGLSAVKPALAVPTATDTFSKPDVRLSISKALAACQGPASNYFKTGGCVSCHAQNATGVAVWAAKPLGVPADYKLEAAQVHFAALQTEPFKQDLFQLQDPPPGGDGMEAALLHISARGAKPNLLTDSLLHYIAAQQRKEGDFPMEGNVRPPLEDGSFTDTAKAIRCFRLFPTPGLQPEYDERVARAARWLVKAEPATTEDRSMQILGIVWSGAKAPKDRVRQLIAKQLADGGWAQNDNLASDAYATGEVLWTLHESGIASSNPAFQRGVGFLLREQEKGGSWHVVTRSLSFQPYFETGFPHNVDQWISQEGTAMAALALTYAAK